MWQHLLALDTKHKLDVSQSFQSLCWAKHIFRVLILLFKDKTSDSFLFFGHWPLTEKHHLGWDSLSAVISQFIKKKALPNTSQQIKRLKNPHTTKAYLCCVLLMKLLHSGTFPQWSCTAVWLFWIFFVWRHCDVVFILCCNFSVRAWCLVTSVKTSTREHFLFLFLYPWLLLLRTNRYTQIP